MDKHREQFDRMTKLVFGPSARLDGSIGSAREPGHIRIVVAGRTLASGPDFATALQAASERLSDSVCGVA
ncbi:MAG: hypothetical protein GXY83_43140 [Rhodopirellula sp.]|nr:hypothetical protein [Rhodopirellula sp.]